MLGSVIGGNGKDKLSFVNEQYSLDLDLSSTKPAAVHYDGKKHEYAFPGYTYYYSRTRMLGDGMFTVNDKQLKVIMTLNNLNI